VTTLEEADQGLGRSEADQDLGVERTADTRRRRAVFNIPRRWGVHRGHGDLGVLHGLDDGRERLPNLAGKAEAWIGVNDDG